MRRALVAGIAVPLSLVLTGGVAVATVGARNRIDSNPSTHPSVGGSRPVTNDGALQPTYLPQPTHAAYVALPPCRVADTAKVAAPLRPGKARPFVVRGTSGFAAQGGERATGCGVPTSATAVSATITVKNHKKRHAKNGSLKVWPFGPSVPTALAASVTKKGATTTGQTLTLAPAGWSSDLQARAAGAKLDVAIDITGYYDVQDHLIMLADGTVWYGSTPHLVSTRHTAGTGQYILTFDHSLSGCNVLTTSNGAANVAVTGNWNGPQLTVLTYETSGGTATAKDEGYQVLVAC